MFAIIILVLSFYKIYSLISIIANKTILKEIEEIAVVTSGFRPNLLLGPLVDGGEMCDRFPRSRQYGAGNTSFLILSASSRCNYVDQINNARDEGFSSLIYEYSSDIRSVKFKVENRSDDYFIAYVYSNDAEDLRFYGLETGVLILYKEVTVPFIYHILPLLIVASGMGILMMVLGGFYAYKLLINKFKSFEITRRIKRLPTRMCVDIDLLDRCPVCLEDYRLEDKLTVLQCGHEFHQKCLMNGRIDICPMCREPLFKQTEGPYIILWQNSPDSHRSAMDISSRDTSPLISSPELPTLDNSIMNKKEKVSKLKDIKENVYA